MSKKNHNPCRLFFNGALIFLNIIFLSVSVYAGDFTRFNSGDFLQKSSISKDRVLVRDKNYKTKGYLLPSVIDSRKTILYDTDGKPKGYFQKDVLDNRKVRFNQTGKSKQDGPSTIDYDKGYLQRSVIDSRKMILYDSDGNSRGYFRKDVIDSRKIRFYEKK
jgi:hypothetical protein